MTQQQGQQLAELLGDLPLALEQAAAYIDTTKLSVNDYLTLIGQRGGDMLGKGRVVGYEHTLNTVWDLALDRVTQQPLDRVTQQPLDRVTQQRRGEGAARIMCLSGA